VGSRSFLAAPVFVGRETQNPTFAACTGFDNACRLLLDLLTFSDRLRPVGAAADGFDAMFCAFDIPVAADACA